MEVTKPPEKIYLQWNDLYWSQITWDEDKINEDDVEYVLSNSKLVEEVTRALMILGELDVLDDPVVRAVSILCDVISDDKDYGK